MYLAGQRVGLRDGVVVGDADQYQQPRPDLADHLAIDGHRGPADRLDHRPHLGSVPRITGRAAAGPDDARPRWRSARIQHRYSGEPPPCRIAAWTPPRTAEIHGRTLARHRNQE